MAARSKAYQKVFQAEQASDPGIIKTIFGSPKMALIWTPIRLYVGWQWITAGIEKVNNPAWTRSGTALKGFWANVVKVDPGQKGAAIHYGWYHDFLKYMLDNSWYTWFAKLIAFGETAIGLALIVGAFVGIAAFFGAMMNFNFMLAGSASTNPVMFGLAILLVLAWKVAGFIGADYYLLQALGTPWKLGAVAHVRERGGKPAGIGRVVAGFAAFAVVFGAAAGLAIVANNQFNVERDVLGFVGPFAGYVITAAGVVAAWLVTETVVHYTHTFSLARKSERPESGRRRAA